MPSLDSRGPRIPAAGYAVGDTGPCRVAVVQSMPSSLLRGSTHAADGHQLLGNRGLTFPAECTGRHPPDLLDPWIGPTWVLLLLGRLMALAISRSRGRRCGSAQPTEKAPSHYRTSPLLPHYSPSGRSDTTSPPGTQVRALQVLDRTPIRSFRSPRSSDRNVISPTTRPVNPHTGPEISTTGSPNANTRR